MSERSLAESRARTGIHGALFVDWLRATSAGWLLGIPIIIVLALAGDLLDTGGVQVLVGAGMGAGIGALQSRVIRTALGNALPWFWSCVIGLALPFLAVDVAIAAGRNLTDFLLPAVAAGGAIAGAWQSLLLRHRCSAWALWIPVSAAGWVLAAGLISLADSLSRSQTFRGIGGALAYLGIVALGGIVLGLVTGLGLQWLFRHDPRAMPAARA